MLLVLSGWFIYEKWHFRHNAGITGIVLTNRSVSMSIVDWIFAICKNVSCNRIMRNVETRPAFFPASDEEVPHANAVLNIHQETPTAVHEEDFKYILDTHVLVEEPGPIDDFDEPGSPYSPITGTAVQNRVYPWRRNSNVYAAAQVLPTPTNLTKRPVAPRLLHIPTSSTGSSSSQGTQNYTPGTRTPSSRGGSPHSDSPRSGRLHAPARSYQLGSISDIQLEQNGRRGRGQDRVSTISLGGPRHQLDGSRPEVPRRTQSAYFGVKS